MIEVFLKGIDLFEYLSSIEATVMEVIEHKAEDIAVVRADISRERNSLPFNHF
jgi:hypothetical protein